MFPETVNFMRADGSGWPIRDWDTANKLLAYVHPEKNPYVVFSFSDESYVKCFGCKTRLTVEARESFDGGFRHWVFGKGLLKGKPQEIQTSTSKVTVDASQLLRMRDARVIIRLFPEHRRFSEAYDREDVTKRFV